MEEVPWAPEESQEACRAHCGEGEASEPQHDLHAIASVLEELLSLESLCRRSELFSQITSQLYVPIAVLMNCAELRELASGDRGAVVEAAKTSQKVLLDPSGTMLKPNVAVRRNTLVLRDIDTEDPQEILALFSDAGCPLPRELRQEESANWVALFEDEDDCLAALDSVRGRTFRGAFVKARVKGEDLLRALHASHPSNCVALDGSYLPKDACIAPISR